MVEDSHPEPINSNDTMEVGESIVDAQPGNEHEKRFPINDSLLVGSGAASNFVPSAPPSFLPYPIIDLSEVAPPLPSQAPPAPVVLPLLANPPQLVSEKNEVEEKLLGELEAMGFTLVDLNKEILRKNDYDLQKTVDDLCGVSEWNTILEELREMVSLVFYFFSFHPFSSYIYIYIHLFIYLFFFPIRRGFLPYWILWVADAGFSRYRTEQETAEEERWKYYACGHGSYRWRGAVV